MSQEKIIKAIVSAINNLENSIEALVKRDGTGMQSYVWLTAADSEYTLFLLSLMRQEELEGSSWKPNVPLKRAEIGPSLTLAQDLLKESKEKVEGGEFHEAYKKAWMARGYLLNVQKILEKRRRDREKSVLPSP